MPLNSFRGALVNGLRSLWNNYSFIRYIFILLFITCCYNFIDTYKRHHYGIIWYNESRSFESIFQECEAKIQFFRDQRNLYITGFASFEFIILWCLFATQNELYKLKTNKQKTQ